MDLINWSLSAFDKIFSPRKASAGEAQCPDGTSVAGFLLDNWSRKWQTLCLEPLMVEDVEDLYLFGFMITGFLLLGLGVALIYRKIVKTEKSTQNLSDNNKEKFEELSERVVAFEPPLLKNNLAYLTELNRNIIGQSTELLKIVSQRRENLRFE